MLELLPEEAGMGSREPALNRPGPTLMEHRRIELNTKNRFILDRAVQLPEAIVDQ